MPLFELGISKFLARIHKIKDTLGIEDLRPVSVLLHVSKILEITFYEQINSNMILSFSRSLCRFKKSHNIQHSFIKIFEK